MSKSISLQVLVGRGYRPRIAEALHEGDIPKSETLLETGASVSKAFHLKRPLIDAINERNYDRVKELIEFGADPNTTVPHLAIARNHLNYHKLGEGWTNLKPLWGANYRESASNPWFCGRNVPAVAVAAMRCDVEIFKLLIESGAAKPPVTIEVQKRAELARDTRYTSVVGVETIDLRELLSKYCDFEGRGQMDKLLTQTFRGAAGRAL